MNEYEECVSATQYRKDMKTIDLFMSNTIEMFTYLSDKIKQLQDNQIKQFETDEALYKAYQELRDVIEGKLLDIMPGSETMH